MLARVCGSTDLRGCADAASRVPWRATISQAGGQGGGGGVKWSVGVVCVCVYCRMRVCVACR